MLWKIKTIITHGFYQQYFSYIILLLLCCLPLLGNAQEEPLGTIALFAAQVELNRLDPQQTTDEAIFFIDESDTVQIEIISNANDLTIQINGPNGEILTPNTIDDFNGEFVHFGAQQAANNLPILPFTLPGFHYLFRFPSLEVGEYQVEFAAQSASTQEVAIITQVVTDSPVATNIFVLPQRPTLVDSTLLKHIVITVPFFEEQQPIPNAHMTAIITSETGQSQELVLFDDGHNRDAKAGDGFYSALFTPQTIGTYQVVVNIQGKNLKGTDCFREVGTSFTVPEPTSYLTGEITDRGVDTNNDGHFDQLEISVGTNTFKTGEYRVFVHLETVQGQRLFRTAAATLTEGSGDITVKFAAEDIRALAEAGPYKIKLIDLIYYGTQGIINSDQLAVGEQTQAYQLDQFQKPLISLTGSTSTEGIDEDGDGRFEKLHVSVEVDLVNSGIYSWTLKLTGPNAERITIAAGFRYFSAGINHLTVDFDGLAIGNKNLNGPYLLKDLIVQGPSLFEVVGDAGETPPFSANQFPVEIAPASCQLYAVHDEGLNQSQFFTVNLTNHQVEPLGTLYQGYDIEAVAIHPDTDLIYASSGNKVAAGKLKGHLYMVDGQTGKLFSIGNTGFEEVDSLAFDTNGTLWGWAKGAGLITIDQNNGQGQLELPSEIRVEDMTLSKKGDTFFYGAVNTDLWKYPPLEMICADQFPNETEALEMMPDNRLLFGTHQDQTFSLHAFDLETCSIIANADIITPFNDIEGLALPQNACQ